MGVYEFILEEQFTNEDVMTWCEVGPKAFEVISVMNHFLQTNEDRANFIQEYEDRLLWRTEDGLKIMALAREVGSYHYPSKTLDELMLTMDTREALNYLFQEPISYGKLQRFKQSKASIADLFAIKKQQPKIQLMQALLYA